MTHERSGVTKSHRIGLVSACLVTSLLALSPGPVGAQAVLSADGDDLLFRERIMEREFEADLPLVNREGRYVVVHLGENRVFVFDGGRAVWSAPAGTGTGFRLDGGGEHRWKFTTPRGLMRIRRMEKDPVWEAPDWHYIEKGLPVPAQNSPVRQIRGAMGTTAIYLGDGIAIHGTQAPGLLLNPDPEARRVSHGCIRLTNEHARELMHIVEVGTPVLIF